MSNDREIPKGSESFRKLNPHLFGVGGVAARQPEPAEAPALDCGSSKQGGGPRGVAIRVSLVAQRRRLLDKDNNVASFKPLQDAIAKSIGIDDGDARIDWEYGQQQTNGKEGVLVKIEY